MAKLAAVIHLPARRQPNDDVVEMLERLLGEARRGSLVGFVAAGHYGGMEYGYFGSGSLVANRELGLAATTRLKFRFI